MQTENTTLVEQEKIPGTPFTLIRQDEKWFIVIGNSRITEPERTKQEAMEKLRTERWLITMHMIIHCINKLQEYNKINTIQQ